ncbi:MAG TPA: MarR family transcriptional regulator [Lactobacillus sp.]|nr:MarR family transcriptional regulator [Lactobacillus sp.]
MYPKEFPIGSALLDLIHEHQRFVDNRLRALKLYPGQDTLLLVLRDADLQSQAQLVKRLDVEHSTITKSVHRMQKTGLLIVSPSEEDQRKRLVSLTPQGRKIADQVHVIYQEAEQFAGKHLTQQELTNMTQGMNRLAHFFKETQS